MGRMHTRGLVKISGLLTPLVIATGSMVLASANTHTTTSNQARELARQFFSKDTREEAKLEIKKQLKIFRLRIKLCAINHMVYYVIMLCAFCWLLNTIGEIMASANHNYVWLTGIAILSLIVVVSIRLFDLTLGLRTIAIPIDEVLNMPLHTDTKSASAEQKPQLSEESRGERSR